jgi:hypothetical protein
MFSQSKEYAMSFDRSFQCSAVLGYARDAIFQGRTQNIMRLI